MPIVRLYRRIAALTTRPPVANSHSELALWPPEPARGRTAQYNSCNLRQQRNTEARFRNVCNRIAAVQFFLCARDVGEAMVRGSPIPPSHLRRTLGRRGSHHMSQVWQGVSTTSVCDGDRNPCVAGFSSHACDRSRDREYSMHIDSRLTGTPCRSRGTGVAIRVMSCPELS